MTDGLTVNFLMETEILAVDKKATLEEACAAMYIGRLKRLMIQEDGRYIGILTVTDVLDALRRVGDRSFFHQNVSEWMTADIASIPIGSSVKELTQKMRDMGITGVPVIDDNDEITGIVTERDVITYDVVWSELDNIEIKADNPIVTTVTEEHTATPDFTFWQIVDRILDGKKRELILVEDEKMVGFVTKMDLIKSITTHVKEIKSSFDFLQTHVINMDDHRFYVPATLPNTLGRFRRLMNVRGISSIPVLVGPYPGYIINQESMIFAHSLWS